MNRKEKIIEYSNRIAKLIDLKLEDKEYNYGKGIGRADNYCVIGDWLIVFEMEFSQRHPEMNVLKVWPFLNKFSDKKIFLIQHILDTKTVSPNRIELCTWIAQKMQVELKNRFGYQLILDSVNPKTILEIKQKLSTHNVS